MCRLQFVVNYDGQHVVCLWTLLIKQPNAAATSMVPVMCLEHMTNSDSYTPSTPLRYRCFQMHQCSPSTRALPCPSPWRTGTARRVTCSMTRSAVGVARALGARRALREEREEKSDRRAAGERARLGADIRSGWGPPSPSFTGRVDTPPTGCINSGTMARRERAGCGRSVDPAGTSETDRQE